MTRIEPAAARATPLRPARVALWDNARLGLIVLVVFGHAIEGLRSDPAAAAAYDVVYAFHMPAFLLIAGWFSRSEALDRRALIGTARLIVTWLAAEAAWVGIRALAGEPALPSTFLSTPAWTLWFLVSLACMRLLLPYLALLRFPLIISVVASLAAGLSPAIGSGFSASRTIALLPFFVLGWRLQQAGVGDAAWFRAPDVRLRLVAGTAALAGVAAMLALTRMPGFTDQLLFWRRGYAAMALDPVQGVLLRSAVLAIGVVLVLALLVLAPRRGFRISIVGRNTIAVYLLHAPVVLLAKKLHLDDAAGALPGGLLLVLLAAVPLALVLGSPPVARVLRPVTDPRAVFARAA